VSYGDKLMSYGEKGFYDIVDRCLTDIYATPTGLYLLESIVQHTAGPKRIKIQPTTGGNQHAGSAGAQLPLVQSFTLGSGYNKIGELKKCMRTLGKLNDPGYGWLSVELAKPMPVIPFPNAIISDVPVTGNDVKRWFTEVDANIYAKTNGQIMNKLQQNSLELRLIICLYDAADASAGGASAISFNPSYMGGEGNKRPPAIGLAHELIHAYYDLIGRQIGTNINHYTTMLYECLCVGLGPWANEPRKHGRRGDIIHNNIIRREWTPNPIDGWHNKARPGPRLKY